MSCVIPRITLQQLANSLPQLANTDSDLSTSAFRFIHSRLLCCQLAISRSQAIGVERFVSRLRARVNQGLLDNGDDWLIDVVKHARRLLAHTVAILLECAAHVRVEEQF